MIKIILPLSFSFLLLACGQEKQAGSLPPLKSPYQATAEELNLKLTPTTLICDLFKKEESFSLFMVFSDKQKALSEIILRHDYIKPLYFYNEERFFDFITLARSAGYIDSGIVTEGSLEAWKKSVLASSTSFSDYNSSMCVRRLQDALTSDDLLAVLKAGLDMDRLVKREKTKGLVWAEPAYLKNLRSKMLVLNKLMIELQESDSVSSSDLDTVQEKISTLLNYNEKYHLLVEKSYRSDLLELEKLYLDEYQSATNDILPAGKPFYSLIFTRTRIHLENIILEIEHD